VIVHQCPDPERLLALAGTVRDVEHNWEVDRYGPRGLAKARMRDRSRIDPELVRAAQPGEAWVIQAGRAVHLRVLPAPAVAPEVVEPAAVLPLGERDTEPLTVVPAPAAGRLAAAVAPPDHLGGPRRAACVQAPPAAPTAAGTHPGLAAAGLAAGSRPGTAMNTPAVGAWSGCLGAHRGVPACVLPVWATPRRVKRTPKQVGDLSHLRRRLPHRRLLWANPRLTRRGVPGLEPEETQAGELPGR